MTITREGIKATPDSIDWSHVHKDFRWMARDGKFTTNRTRLFVLEPDKPYQWSNHWRINSRDERLPADARSFSSFKQGTCDWKDSLVERPGQ